MNGSVGKATAVGCIAILLWSCLALLTVASGRIPPFETAALTFAIGAAAGLGVTAFRGELRLLHQPAAVWRLGVGGLFGYHALYFAALRLAPPAQAGLLNYMWPLLIVLFSALLPGERLLTRHIAGCVFGGAGVVALFLADRNAAVGIEPRFALGYALALAAAFVWAGYSVLSRRFGDVPSAAVGGFCLATAALAALCHVAFETTVMPGGALPWLALVGLGLGPVGLAFYVWDHGVKRGDIRLLGVASYAAPVLSTLLLVTAGFAAPSWGLALACLLIATGGLVATHPFRRAGRPG